MRPAPAPARVMATRLAIPMVLVAIVVAGCSGSTAPSQGPRGAHVRVLGMWSGPELDSFKIVTSAWEKATGAIVDWEGTTDLPGALAGQVQAGDPPDIAILPNLAVMDQLADDGTLIALDSILDMQQVAKDYAPAWLELGRRRGTLYGIFYKVTTKAAVWYSPRAFAAANYRVPTTWTDLITLADRMVADGRTPFSVVAPNGPGSGWALTDWISAIVLKTCGPALYDQWIAAAIPWNQACIKQSFDMFVGIVSTKGYVLGGSQRITATGDDVAADPLYTDPPTAYMCVLASFAQAFIAANHPALEPGPDYDVFPFPAINPDDPVAVTVGADVPVMVSDTAAGRAFMTYLESAPAQEAWIKLGGFTSVNRSVPLDAYQDPVARKIAAELSRAEVTRFSAGDMMPTSLQRTWWAAMLDLVRDPGAVDSILDRMTAAARSAP